MTRTTVLVVDGWGGLLPLGPLMNHTPWQALVHSPPTLTLAWLCDWIGPLGHDSITLEGNKVLLHVHTSEIYFLQHSFLKPPAVKQINLN